MIEVLPVDVIKVVLSFLPFESWLSIFLTSKLMFHSAKKAFDPSVDNNRALRFAIRRRYLHLISELLEDKRVDPSQPHNIPFLIACTEGNPAVVKLLLSHPKIKVTFDAARFAVQRDNWEIIATLLQDGRLDPTANENLLLLQACKFGLLDTMKVLINDSRVNTRDKRLFEPYTYRTQAERKMIKTPPDQVQLILHQHNKNI